jgi:hypothetical protein
MLHFWICIPEVLLKILAAISTNEAVFVGSASLSDEVVSDSNVLNYFKDTYQSSSKPETPLKEVWRSEAGENLCENNDSYIRTSTYPWCFTSGIFFYKITKSSGHDTCSTALKTNKTGMLFTMKTLKLKTHFLSKTGIPYQNAISQTKNQNQPLQKFWYLGSCDI